MRSLLLCVDGSRYTKICAKYAIELARLMDAYVDVLYVTNLNSAELSLIADCEASLGIQPFHELSATLQSLEKKKFQRLERKVTRMFNNTKYDIKFKFNHRSGAVVDAFDEFKHDVTGLDLVILGKRGESSGTAKGHLGSSLERILRTCSCPCFIVPETFQPSLKKILIAYDGSDGINKAIQFVERNHFFKNCEIHLLTVDPTEDTRAQFSSAKSILRDVAKLNITAIERSGDAVDEIEKYIEEKHINLLIIGAYSHSIVRHFFVGSTTLEIVKQSIIPVVVFK